MMATDGRGHYFAAMQNGLIDAWGDGPFSLRVGRKRYYFIDSDMFGPLLENAKGVVLKAQPIHPNHPFWAPYHMWRKLGRRGKRVGWWIVCRWRAPRPGQFKRDGRGKIHQVIDPEWEPLGYLEIAP